mgnify:CR=1 FL=1
MIVSAVDSIATDKYCFFIKVLPAFLYGGNKDYHNIELFQQSLWGNISYIENEKTHFHLSMFPCFHLSSFALPGPISTQNKRSKATTQALDLLTILKKLQNIQLRFTLPLIFDAEVNYCFNYAEDS